MRNYGDPTRPRLYCPGCGYVLYVDDFVRRSDPVGAARRVFATQHGRTMCPGSALYVGGLLPMSLPTGQSR